MLEVCDIIFKIIFNNAYSKSIIIDIILLIYEKAPSINGATLTLDKNI